MNERRHVLYEQYGLLFLFVFIFPSTDLVVYGRIDYVLHIAIGVLHLVAAAASRHHRIERKTMFVCITDIGD